VLARYTHCYILDLRSRQARAPRRLQVDASPSESPNVVRFHRAAAAAPSSCAGCRQDQMHWYAPTLPVALANHGSMPADGAGTPAQRRDRRSHGRKESRPIQHHRAKNASTTRCRRRHYDAERMRRLGKPFYIEFQHWLKKYPSCYQRIERSTECFSCWRARLSDKTSPKSTWALGTACACWLHRAGNAVQAKFSMPYCIAVRCGHQ